MVSLAPDEGSVGLQALVKRRGWAQSGGGICVAASGLCVLASLPPPTMCTRTHTLTQKQVKDPGGHPAGAEGGQQAAEIRLPVGLQLLGYSPGGIKSYEPKSQPGPTPRHLSPSPVHGLQRQQLGLRGQLQRQLHGHFRDLRHHRQHRGLWLLCLSPGPGRKQESVELGGRQAGTLMRAILKVTCVGGLPPFFRGDEAGTGLLFLSRF